MAEMELDLKELDAFCKSVLDLATEEPKQAKSFMRTVGNKMRSNVRKGYKSAVNKRSGRLLKGLKRGKVYRWHGNEWHVRVYSALGKGKAGYANIVEYGRKQHGALDGKGVIKKERSSFGDAFAQATEKFVDKLLAKGFY